MGSVSSQFKCVPPHCCIIYMLAIVASVVETHKQKQTNSVGQNRGEIVFADMPIQGLITVFVHALASVCSFMHPLS